MPATHILLVEDDAVLRDLLRRNLQARGHEVRLAEDARTALAELRAAPVDLVILDINLPDQSGWDVLRVAQKQGWLHPQHHQKKNGNSAEDAAKLPVVVLSAVRVSLARLQEFHPLAYLPKPFPMDALLRLAAEAAPAAGTLSQEDTGQKMGLLRTPGMPTMTGIGRCTRRNNMLDLIVVVVTLISFVAFIAFTEGCERL